MSKTRRFFDLWMTPETWVAVIGVTAVAKVFDPSWWSLLYAAVMLLASCAYEAVRR